MPRPSAWRNFFFPRLKSSYLLGKRIETDFLAVEKNFPWLKSHFSSISHAKMYFLARDKNLSWTKYILSGQTDQAFVTNPPGTQNST